MARTVRRMGWKPQLPDVRDRKFAMTQHYVKDAVLPQIVDLRPKMPAIYDQGDAGSCVGNGTARVVNFLMPNFMPSRLFIYWGARDLEGDTGVDAGAQIRDGVKVVSTLGVCPESEWSYDVANNLLSKPSPNCYADAKARVVTKYTSLNSPEEVKQALALGFPVVFGMTVYSSFMGDQTASTGIVTMPKKNESVEGGHCTVLSGYDLTGKALNTKGVPVGCPCYFGDNSWGASWGDQGRYFAPVNLIDNPDVASDFWMVEQDVAQTVA